MHHPHRRQARRVPMSLPVLIVALAMCVPELCLAQASPFMTGASALQTNILAWLTPIAIILIMVLGGMAMANRIAQVSSTYGQGDAHTIIENCGNTLILRCSASEGGGTARFASQLVGEREVLRTSISRSRRATELIGTTSRSEHVNTEHALLASQIEQLPDLTGYLKYASEPAWHRVQLNARAAWEDLRRSAASADSAARAARTLRTPARSHEGHGHE
jgi:hypothetical protein